MNKKKIKKKEIPSKRKKKTQHKDGVLSDCDSSKCGNSHKSPEGGCDLGPALKLFKVSFLFAFFPCRNRVDDPIRKSVEQVLVE